MINFETFSKIILLGNQKPLNLSNHQVKLFEVFEDYQYNIIKAHRRAGVTTFLRAYLVWKMLTQGHGFKVMYFVPSMNISRFIQQDIDNDIQRITSVYFGKHLGSTTIGNSSIIYSNPTI